MDIDECVSMPCLNDGVCIDRVNQYECNCTANYSGNHCEFDVSSLNCCHFWRFVYFTTVLTLFYFKTLPVLSDKCILKF